MNIIIFGATGGIGKILVKQAINEGNNVKAYMRNPIKFDFVHKNLEVIKGELNEYDKIKNSMVGIDCVISTLGPPIKRNYEGFAVFDGHKNIINTMKALNVKRFITLATPSVKFEKDVSPLATRLPTI